MARLFIRHGVEDYDTWRKIYDEAEDLRRSHGVTAATVHRGVDDANDITVIHDFATADEARGLVAAEELKDAMGRAGVVMPPSAWITEDA